MKLPWQTHQAPAVAFAVLALVGGYGLKTTADEQSNKLYKTQIETCERGNSLRVESNRRIDAHATDRDVLRAFLVAAKDARVAAYERDRNMSDKAAADEYQRQIIKLDQVTFRPVAIVDCKKVIQRP
jgi:hypothetical protein